MLPAVRKRDGLFNAAAPISMPGTILSQLHKKTMPSKPCARAIASIEAAIRSRCGRMVCMPSPWAMPSQGAGTSNSAGTPSAAQMPSLTYSTSCLKARWPGLTSVYEFAMPMIGFFKSSVR